MKSGAEHMPSSTGNLSGYSRDQVMPRASVGIDNLRAVVIVMVLAFHAMTAYIAFIPTQPFALDAPPYLWRAFPIVDQQRFFGFDLFCGWLDVFLMSFFYLLSGLFVWSSLTREGPTAVPHDRMRLRGCHDSARVCLSEGPAAASRTAVRRGGPAADAADLVPELCAEHRRHDA